MKTHPLRSVILQFWIEALAWPLLCLALMQGLVSIGLLDRQGWNETLALWKTGAQQMEQRTLTKVDRVLRDKVDPVLIAAAQKTERQLNNSIAPFATAVAPGVAVQTAHKAATRPAPAVQATAPAASPVEVTLPSINTRTTAQASQTPQAPIAEGLWEVRAF